jgi:hypothetical protein
MRTIREHFAVSTLTLAIQGALLAMFAAPLVAVAADADQDVATLTQPTNSVEIGAENVSKKSAKFGEYNGLNKSGADLIGNFSARGGDAYQSYDGGTGVTRWEIKGTDLGTTSREVGGAVSQQGAWNLGVNYDQLRHHITDSYQTPFQGTMGGNNLVIPGTFGVIDATDDDAVGTGTQGMTANQLASFRTVDVYTDRKNTSFNAGYTFNRQWSVQFDFNRLDQSGAKLIGVSMSPDALGVGAGEKVATLMNPTNYKTDTFDIAATWLGEKGHLTASYFASIFKDGYSSLSWSNPFIDSGGGSALTGSAPAGGAFPMNTFATPPNNNFQQLNLLGGYDFTSATTLAGDVLRSQHAKQQFHRRSATDVGVAAGGAQWPGGDHPCGPETDQSDKQRSRAIRRPEVQRARQPHAIEHFHFFCVDCWRPLGRGDQRPGEQQELSAGTGGNLSYRQEAECASGVRLRRRQELVQQFAGQLLPVGGCGGDIPDLLHQQRVRSESEQQGTQAVDQLQAEGGQRRQS